MQIRSVRIDLGKTTFHLVALGTSGKVLMKKKFSRKQLPAFTANMQTFRRRPNGPAQQISVHCSWGGTSAISRDGAVS
jgi:hypothetical protein